VRLFDSDGSVSLSVKNTMVMQISVDLGKVDRLTKPTNAINYKYNTKFKHNLAFFTYFETLTNLKLNQPL
jgi:hypothetical protein